MYQYTDVNSSYMLTDTKKGGNRRCKKGGNFDLLSSTSAVFQQGKDLLNIGTTDTSVVSNEPVKTSQAVKAEAVGATPVVKTEAVGATLAVKGGNRRCKKGGNFDLLSGSTLLKQTTALLENNKGGDKNGGCACSSVSKMRKGGAIELAPFAAAVALLAARYMTDMNDIDNKPKRTSRTTSRTISRTTSRTKK